MVDKRQLVQREWEEFLSTHLGYKSQNLTANQALALKQTFFAGIKVGLKFGDADFDSEEISEILIDILLSEGMLG